MSMKIYFFFFRIKKNSNINNCSLFGAFSTLVVFALVVARIVYHQSKAVKCRIVPDDENKKARRTLVCAAS